MEEYEVWGFTIRQSASGKKIWPNELKWEATRRIWEEGQSAGDVASEIGAHECLVRKWSVADRRSQGEKIQVEGPAFAALNIECEAPPIEPPAPTRSTQTGAKQHNRHGGNTSQCRKNGNPSNIFYLSFVLICSPAHDAGDGHRIGWAHITL
ncbi:hypothetical protein [Shimia thalassica]|uniref:hypothetical protein n=1 Tax=Shimia thalassica TaxID=1715693 RepID=UPI002493E233|nr:hypothetical protein [Shimia thalassica]